MEKQILSKQCFVSKKNRIFLIQNLEKPANKGDNVSLNKTVLDGSVIIHSGTNPLGRDQSMISGNFGING